MINRGDILIGLATEGNTEMITRLVELYGANVNHVHSKDVVRVAVAVVDTG
jgi:hypothetical protein